MNNFIIIVLGLLAFEYLLERLMDYLNIKHFSDQIPEEFKGVYTEEKYATSQRYNRVRTRFSIISDTINLPIIIAFILLGGFAWVDGLACQWFESTILRGLTFAFVLMLLSQLIEIPFSLYSTFVIEEKFGFNKTTIGTFIGDLLKGLLIGCLIGGPILALVIWFFDSFQMAWLWAWIAVVAIQIILLYLYPVWIMPLFNKFEPLEDGELKTAIQDYAQKEKFVLQDVYKVDGSKRSTKSNAYFTGFGKSRRVVLYDTLIENHTVNELVAVLAHEIGHFKLKHIIKMMVVSFLYLGALLFVLSLFIGVQGMYDAFQVQGTPVYAGLIFFSFLFKPISRIFGIAVNLMSRKHEFEADAFAVNTTGEAESLVAALKKLSVDNLSNLTPHPFIVFMEYSHPPTLERIVAMRNEAAKG